jgi:hypothetical protein
MVGNSDAEEIILEPVGLSTVLQRGSCHELGQSEYIFVWEKKTLISGNGFTEVFKARIHPEFHKFLENDDDGEVILFSTYS